MSSVQLSTKLCNPMQEHHKLYGNKGLSDINKVVFNAGLVPVIVSAPVCMHVKDGEDW